MTESEADYLFIRRRWLELLTVDQAFGCFIARLRGTNRGRRSIRQDLIRMFWHWNERPHRGPVFERDFPIKKLTAHIMMWEDKAIDDQVSRFFSFLPGALGPVLGEYMIAEKAALAKKALSAAAEQTKLACYRRDNKSCTAVGTWQGFFGEAFPRVPREAASLAAS